MTTNMSFDHRRSVLEVEAGGVHNGRVICDERLIQWLVRMISYTSLVRRARLPYETQISGVLPLPDGEIHAQSTEVEVTIFDYNLLDLSLYP